MNLSLPGTLDEVRARVVRALKEQGLVTAPGRPPAGLAERLGALEGRTEVLGICAAPGEPPLGAVVLAESHGRVLVTVPEPDSRSDVVDDARSAARPFPALRGRLRAALAAVEGEP